MSALLLGWKYLLNVYKKLVTAATCLGGRWELDGWEAEVEKNSTDYHSILIDLGIHRSTSSVYNSVYEVCFFKFSLHGIQQIILDEWRHIWRPVCHRSRPRYTFHNHCCHCSATPLGSNRKLLIFKICHLKYVILRSYFKMDNLQ